MPADQTLANAFFDQHPEDAAQLLANSPPGAVAEILRRMPPYASSRILKHLDQTQARPVSEALGLQTLALMVRPLESSERDAMLTALPQHLNEPLKQLLQYPDGSAGALADPQIMILNQELTAGEARKRFKQHSRNALYYLYITDEKQKLTGVINFRELLLAERDRPLTQFMSKRLYWLSAFDPHSVIVAHPAWQFFHALPVINREGLFVGAIRYKVLRRLDNEVTSQQTPNIILGLAGLGELYWVSMASFLNEVAQLTTASSNRDRTHK